MFWYAVRRLNLFVITLAILTMVGFSILRLDPESVWARAEYWHGWSIYLSELAQLNFGVSKSGAAIYDELAVVFPATLELCFFAFLVALLVGIPFGTIAGMKQGKWVDTTISFVSMSGYSAPLFWVALLMLMVFSLHFEIFPVLGATIYFMKSNTSLVLPSSMRFLRKGLTKLMHCRASLNIWYCPVWS